MDKYTQETLRKSMKDFISKDLIEKQVVHEFGKLKSETEHLLDKEAVNGKNRVDTQPASPVSVFSETTNQKE
jgi:hypothetical protein